MSFSNKEQGHAAEGATVQVTRISMRWCAPNIATSLQFSVPMATVSRQTFAFEPILPDALSVQCCGRWDNGEELGSLEATQTPGLFVGHFDRAQAYLLRTRWAGGENRCERRPYSFGYIARRNGFVPVRRRQSP